MEGPGPSDEQRLSPGLVRRAAWGIAAVAFIATWVLHGVPERNYPLWQDPIVAIGLTHAFLFAAAALLAARQVRTAMALLLLGSFTGPWAAILVDRADPLHQAYLILPLASVVVASLVASPRVVTGIGVANATGLLALRATIDQSTGLHVTAFLMTLVFTFLLGGARALWDMDRRQLASQEEALRASMRQALEVEKMRQVDAMRKRFLNTASHELNTPLTPILLQTHMMREAIVQGRLESVAPSLDVVDRNTRRLKALVKDILDVARIEAEEMQLERQPMSLDAVVRQEVTAMAPVAEQAGVALDVEAEPVELDADPLRMAQLVSNLLVNAVKFTDPGGHVHVRLRGGPEAVLEVQDEGRGWQLDKQGDLFRPFGQIHEPDARLGGTGLGLFICHGIVNAHGGRIEAHSDGPGQGATFTVHIPTLRRSGL